MPKADEDDEAPRRDRPRRGGVPKNYKDPTDTENLTKDDDDDDDSIEEGASSSSEELMEDNDEESEVVARKSSRHRPAIEATRSPLEGPLSRRTSSRSNKFSSSMAEPPPSLRDLFRKQSDAMDTDDDEVIRKPRARSKAPPLKRSSPQKSPARRHAQRRHSLAAEEHVGTSDASSSDEEDEEEDDDEEPLKIQRIIASRTETRKKWQEICRGMNTSEMHYGSRWFQSEEETAAKEGSDENAFEERFLVKWADLSFLHTSWETQRDLVDQVEAKTYLTTFFRKSVNGLLYSQDERCDGDYFDPAFTEIERILEVQLPEHWDENTKLSSSTEDSWGTKSFGMIMDKADPEFDNGTGRQFLIKWCNMPYSESTYEFERDLIINEIEYKEHVKAFLSRNVKPAKAARRSLLKQGEDEYKRLYKIFGDKSKQSESNREKAVEEYKQNLQKVEYKNGGELRDYQAEGVAWMIANFVNQRSCILADEMGLGKTLQTAAMANLLATALNRGGPVLIVAPLSTLPHWHREFTRWTDLNAVIYHGSADDRQLIREYEFVYECDRPQTAIAFNQLYLKKCVKKNMNKTDSPWMIDVVVTSPEMMIADDAVELAAIHWEVLVVDEAHRLKNYSSKLAIGLRSEKFTFRHRLLLTGTPIQNDVQEFWTLLNFIDPDSFNDLNAFMERYGDMKSKERVDELHEEIRPYILRRLKEDVERSVPPKEETLIEVELTVAQKQYYRALYEKNVKFLHKNKKKALDGPSLNNLAMQLRKCCNHLFLLNGVEEEFRRKQEVGMSEGDFLVKGSGKLVLLDKLLPRLKEEGHRVLLFSQFKIMLDILEDYLRARGMKFERIDGSITGNKRQQAIDRFQTPGTEDKEAPFIMMLSTRAGGVGITLTAADTCIIVDSDWNPQNDLQAQARCHRIGQTKSVKIYRLLTRKTYEMQMFHMSSLKMGLDQAVLKGFESGASGEGALSKEEVERLLRHGAYDIFNEDKAGEAEAESNDFVQQDIDSILQRRSHTVVHENTGSKSNAAGGTFSKASFKAKTLDPNSKSIDEDIDIEDPDFWKKMIGEGSLDDAEEVATERRPRTQKNYSEIAYKKQLEAALLVQSSDGENDSDSSDEDGATGYDSDERLRWGGSLPCEWKKDDVESIVKALSTYGYNRIPWDEFAKCSELTKLYGISEVKRMCWTVVLTTLLESADDDVGAAKKRDARTAEKVQEESTEVSKPGNGGVLAVDRSSEVTIEDADKLKQKAFEKHWRDTSNWMGHVLSDAIAFASDHAPREKEQLDRILRKTNGSSHHLQQSKIASMFATSVWPSLKSRGWNAELITEGDTAGKTRYSYLGKEYYTTDLVLKAVQNLHPELQNVVETMTASAEFNKKESAEARARDHGKDLALSVDDANPEHIRSFLERYGAVQLIFNRTNAKRIRLPRKILSSGTLLCNASTLIRRAIDSAGIEGSSVDQLATSLAVDKRMALPHPMWTARHDSVLIHAIAKHGWIDHDSAVRAIANDPAVKWGAPFGKTDGCKTTVPCLNYNTDQILATAERAAAFFTGNSEMVDDLKGFNHQLVIRSYGLFRQSQGEDEFGQPKGRPWVVDRAQLQLAGESCSGMAVDSETVDLPPKKDLVRRAKAILSKAISHPVVNKQDDAVENTHDYTELDQRDGANVFLAEMLRGILKEPSNSKYNKTLCSLASEEARRRADSLSSQTNGELAKTAADLCRIAEHIDEVKRNLSKAATQYKNVLRVILGEEVQKPRKDGERLFPTKRNISALETMTTSRDKDSTRKSGVKLSGQPFGEKAVDLARQRLLQRYGFNDGASATSDIELELTEIETLILSAVCAIGIPVWRDDWRSMLDGVASSSALGSSSFTWESFGNFVAQLADKSFERAKEKLAKEREKHKGKSAADSDTRRVEFANQTYKATEAVVSQAREYAAEPETLAKKAILLISKICQQMQRVTISKLTTRSDHGLGPKIVNWFVNEISRWAASLDLLDDFGLPLGFTAVEFLVELPEAERRAIYVSSVIDKQGCRLVASQAALLTRTRSLFSLYDNTSLLAKITKVAASLKSAGATWDKQPDGWNLNSDAVLLKRLMDNGLTNEMLNDSASFGGQSPPSVQAFSSATYRLSRGALQLRANQLTRELHALEESMHSFRILEERRNEHSVAAVPTVALKAGHQTGLHSYFTAKAEGRPENGNDPDDVQVLPAAAAQEPCEYSDVEIIDSPRTEKRKQEGKSYSETNAISPGKKHRVS